MVAYCPRVAPPTADEVFRALADPTRRALLDALRRADGQTLSDLCANGSMTRQAVSKHLAVLEGANLVTVVRRGRSKFHYLNPVPLHDLAARWIRTYEPRRLAALDRLRESLEGRPMTKPEFVYTIYIHATSEQVYDALLDPELIAQYMGGTGPQSSWEVGAPILWKDDPAGDFEDRGQKVLVADRPHKLSYTWHTYKPEQRELFETDEAFQEGLREHTTVTFTIEKAEIAQMDTRLVIEHTGFASLESPMLNSVAVGWRMILSELKSVLERAA